MKKRILFSCHLTAAILMSTALTSHADSGALDYSDQKNPKKWPEPCQKGALQSPIDIDPATVNFGPSSNITFVGYKEFKWAPERQHAPIVEAVVKEPWKVPYFEVWLGGKKRQYSFVRLHFHSPSEHQIDSNHAAMELHLVHYGVRKIKDSHALDKNDKAVVAILFKKGEANGTLETYLEGAKALEDETIPIPLMKGLGGLDGMLRRNSAYYGYKGSLTTPTPKCTEDVTWFVLEQMATASQGQINRFRVLMGNIDTNRDIQTLRKHSVTFHPEKK
jgi:carbonic anhydrase